MNRFPFPAAVALFGLLVSIVGCGGQSPSSPGGTFMSAPLFRTAFGSNPDGGFEALRGLAVGSDGRIYAYDAVQGRVQVLAHDGRFLGAFDGRLADDPTGARTPAELLMAPDGTLYVTDPGGRTIEQWSTSGARLRRIVPTTPESPGGFRPERLAVAPDGTLFVTDPEHHHVVRLRPDGAYDLHWGRDCDEPDGFRGMGPIAVAPDGTVWVANRTSPDELKQFTAGGAYLRRVNALPTLFPGYPYFLYPIDIQFFADGRLVVLDGGWGWIFELTPTAEELKAWDLTLYRFTPDDCGAISYVYDSYLALAPDGLILYGSYQLGEIRRIDPGATAELEPIGHAFGSGTELRNATDIRFDASGQLLALRGDGRRLWHFDPSGVLARMDTFSDCAPPDSAFRPSAITIGAEGALYVADKYRDRILKVDPDGHRVPARAWSRNLLGLHDVSAMAIARDGTVALAGAGGSDLTLAFLSPDGSLRGRQALPEIPGSDASRIRALEVDRDSRFWLLDAANPRLTAWTTMGAAAGEFDMTAATDGALRAPVDLAIDAYDEFHVLDATGVVFRFAADGRWLGRWGSPGTERGMLDRPVALAVDPTGRVALIDRYGSRIQVFGGRS